MDEITIYAEYDDSMVVINLMESVNSALKQANIPWHFVNDEQQHDGREVYFFKKLEKS